MTIQVVVSTYCPEEWVDAQGDYKHPRTDYLFATLHSLRDNLKAQEPIEYILANDGPASQRHATDTASDIFDWPKKGAHRFQIAGGPRVGLGGSLNRALGLVHPDNIWMYTTDDWVLTAKYNLTQAIRVIREHGYDYVRLGPPHPDIVCKTKFCRGLGWWLELQPECGGFAFATRPFLATREFYDAVGGFREHCDAYEVETNYAAKVRYLVEHGPEVLQLAEVVNGSLEGPWEHVGDVQVGNKYP